MRVSKKGGITIFSLLGLLMAAIIILHQNPGPSADPQEELLKKILSCAMILVACLVFARWYEKFTTIPVELYQSRHLIWKLARNDFKKRYAGSYMGALWALAQPVVTVGMYYIVFDKLMGNSGRGAAGVPFVVFLTAGLVPWFYFNEALNNGTNALREYDYLVKKVVFKISILPMVKLISALFVHGFFVLFAVVLFSCYGYYPDLYELQIFYYTLSMFVFVLGICYATSAIVIFFRDLSQIITIVLQVGIWMVPIMWNLNILPAKYHWAFKLNPMYYIVSGYRDAFYQKAWFWQHFDMTVYFWAVTIALFGLGTTVFKRLKIHFADVL